MKKAVLFDVGGVIVTSPVKIIQEYERELGLPRFMIGGALVKGSPDNAFCRMERGEINLSQFCDECLTECRVHASLQGITLPSEFSIRELFHRISHQLNPIPQTLYALKKLKTLGFKTCIVTNNWIDDMHPNDRGSPFPFRRYVDVLIESCKVGIRKPDTRIYQLACDRLNVEPNEVVFLDDLGVNLKSARALGIATILFKEQDCTDAITELERVLGLEEGSLKMNIANKL